MPESFSFFILKSLHCHSLVGSIVNVVAVVYTSCHSFIKVLVLLDKLVIDCGLTLWTCLSWLLGIVVLNVLLVSKGFSQLSFKRRRLNFKTILDCMECIAVTIMHPSRHFLVMIYKVIYKIGPMKLLSLFLKGTSKTFFTVSRYNGRASRGTQN